MPLLPRNRRRDHTLQRRGEPMRMVLDVQELSRRLHDLDNQRGPSLRKHGTFDLSEGPRDGIDQRRLVRREYRKVCQNYHRVQ